ncbi:MAG: DUF4760 domain-containing protein [bacterium]|nr:DUF4760 domain-containing protein [bacterium]MCP4966128.1 DUF4760 domain-containing protein [bacterium]
MTDWLVANRLAILSGAAIASVIVNLGLLSVVLVQLGAMKRDSRKDHARRRSEATLFFWNELMEAQKKPRSLITQKYGEAQISEDEAKRLLHAASHPGGDDDDMKMGHLIRGYLNCLERLATGVHLNIFDEATLKRVGKYRFTHSNNQFRHFINLTNHRTGRKDVYTEFTSLATSWSAETDLRGGDGSLDDP